MVFLGALLDARSNALALGNGEAWGIGFLLVLCWVVAEAYVRVRRTRWRSQDGTVVRVTGLGMSHRLAFIGALGMLTYSRFASPPAVPHGYTTPTVTDSARSTLALLAAEIERHLREFTFATGFQSRLRRDASIPETVEVISETWRLPPGFKRSVAEFAEVQRQINHGYNVSDDDVLRAIESGRLILRTLRDLSREKKVVVHTGVELFADAAGRQPLRGVWGVILENTSSDGKGTKSLQIFPTSRTDLRTGDEIAWEWSFLTGKPFGQTWYRNPQTGQIEHAWQGSMEFVGRPLGDVHQPPR